MPIPHEGSTITLLAYRGDKGDTGGDRGERGHLAAGGGTPKDPSRNIRPFLTTSELRMSEQNRDTNDVSRATRKEGGGGCNTAMNT